MKARKLGSGKRPSIELGNALDIEVRAADPQAFQRLHLTVLKNDSGRCAARLADLLRPVDERQPQPRVLDVGVDVDGATAVRPRDIKKVQCDRPGDIV